jgi:hypothetical protein
MVGFMDEDMPPATAMPPLSPEDQRMVDAFEREARKPLRPGDPRRHHFIPQFFLKRFATKDEQLLVIPIGEGERRIAHVSKVAVMIDLYTSIDKDVGETVAVERLLGLVDGKAAAAIKRLAIRLPIPPQLQDHGILAIWIALLSVRDPHTRRRMEASADHLLKAQASLAANPNVARQRLSEQLGREPTDEEVREMVDSVGQLDLFEVVPHQSDLVKIMLETAQAASPYLATRFFTVMHFGAPGLVLSDRPLVLSNHPENRDSFRGIGLVTADVILLPLDRECVLVLHSEDWIGNCSIDSPAGYTIDQVNQLVVGNAVSEIYCHPDDEGRLQELVFPEPDQPLMHVSGASWLTARTDGVNSPPRRRRHRRYRGA